MDKWKMKWKKSGFGLRIIEDQMESGKLDGHSHTVCWVYGSEKCTTVPYETRVQSPFSASMLAWLAPKHRSLKPQGFGFRVRG